MLCSTFEEVLKELLSKCQQDEDYSICCSVHSVGGAAGNKVILGLGMYSNSLFLYYYSVMSLEYVEKLNFT